MTIRPDQINAIVRMMRSRSGSIRNMGSAPDSQTSHANNLLFIALEIDAWATALDFIANAQDGQVNERVTGSIK